MAISEVAPALAAETSRVLCVSSTIVVSFSGTQKHVPSLSFFLACFPLSCIPFPGLISCYRIWQFWSCTFHRRRGLCLGEKTWSDIHPSHHWCKVSAPQHWGCTVQKRGENEDIYDIKMIQNFIYAILIYPTPI